MPDVGKWPRDWNARKMQDWRGSWKQIISNCEKGTAHPPWTDGPLNQLSFREIKREELPTHLIGNDVVGQGRLVRALGIQFVDCGIFGFIRVGICGVGAGASRGFGDVARSSDNVRECTSIAGSFVLHVLVTANRLLDVAEVEDTSGTVRTLLPGAGTDEEDRDEGEQDEDDDRQFEEGHTGLALDGGGLC